MLEETELQALFLVLNCSDGSGMPPPPYAQVFEHFVPSWWAVLEELESVILLVEECYWWQGAGL